MNIFLNPKDLHNCFYTRKAHTSKSEVMQGIQYIIHFEIFFKKFCISFVSEIKFLACALSMNVHDPSVYLLFLQLQYSSKYNTLQIPQSRSGQPLLKKIRIVERLILLLFAFIIFSGRYNV